MQTFIDTIELQDGNIQKYQIVKGFEWDDLKYKECDFDEKVLIKMRNLYKENIISKNPSLYGNLYFYRLPLNIELNLMDKTPVGVFFDKTMLLNYYLQLAVVNNQVSLRNNNLNFEDSNLQRIFDQLEDLNLVSMTNGALDTITFMPIYEKYGFMSKLPKYPMIVNSHFFLMDMSDKDSEFDLFGTPHGLVIYKNEILLPPLNHRNALFVDYKNNVEIKTIELEDLEIKIGSNKFIDSVNCRFFYRPDTRVTSATEGMDIIIVNKRVVAIKNGGVSKIPMAGFIIQVDKNINLNSLDVEYLFDENYKIAIEVGPALMINGKKTTKMNCPFYEGKGTAYPSTVYPLDFNLSRAARIGLGVLNNKPIFIWAEGAGKLGFVKGKESCGASLSEFAEYCDSKGISNMINLDGGGSAQIIFNDKRYLKIADRLFDTVTEDERAVPNCWVL